MDIPAASSCTSRFRMANSSAIRAHAGAVRRASTQARKPGEPRASEIGLDRHWYLQGGLVGKERVRILGADQLPQWAFRRTRQLRNAFDRHLTHGRLVLPEALDAGPRHREGAWILDTNVRLQHGAVLDQVEALDDMQILGVRRSKSINPRSLIDADRVDDQRVTFITANGFAIPGRLDVRQMLVGEVDVPNLLLAGEDHHHDLRRLNEIHRLGHGSQQEAGNANRPATRVRWVDGLAGEDKLVALTYDLPGPGLQDRCVKVSQLLGRLPSGHTKFVVGHVRTRAILLHRTGTARGRDELAIVGIPADIGAGCKIWCEIGCYVLRHRRTNEVDRAGENARREASCMSGHVSGHWKPPLRELRLKRSEISGGRLWDRQGRHVRKEGVRIFGRRFVE